MSCCLNEEPLISLLYDAAARVYFKRACARSTGCRYKKQNLT